MSAPRFPALAEWRRQIAAGQRTVSTLDSLWRQACEELTRAESGLPRDDAEVLRREARVALAKGQRSRAWLLRARAAAIADGTR